jgi:hypothetical protein
MNYYNLPIKNIDFTVVNCRQIDELHVETLYKQLESGNPLPPINCRVSHIDPNRYEVISGQHRLEAFRRFGCEYVVSTVSTLNDFESFQQSVNENVKRKSLLQTEEDKIVYDYYIKFNKPIKWISEELKVTGKTVKDRIMRHHFLDESLKLKLDSSTLKIGEATLLSALFPKYQQKAHIKMSKFSNFKGKKLRYDTFVKKYPTALHNFSIKDLKSKIIESSNILNIVPSNTSKPSNTTISFKSNDSKSASVNVLSTDKNRIKIPIQYRTNNQTLFNLEHDKMKPRPHLTQVTTPSLPVNIPKAKNVPLIPVNIPKAKNVPLIPSKENSIKETSINGLSPKDHLSLCLSKVSNSTLIPSKNQPAKESSSREGTLPKESETKKEGSMLLSAALQEKEILQKESTLQNEATLQNDTKFNKVSVNGKEIFLTTQQLVILANTIKGNKQLEDLKIIISVALNNKLDFRN